MKMNHAVIMAGGIGERFWPLSRKSKPKQVVAIHTDKSMIQETVDRLRPVFGENIFISTGNFLADKVREIMPEINFILEPMAKNTAACIGLSAITLLKKDPEAIMFLETSDHIYNDVNLYLKHVEYALNAAKRDDRIILIGIKPTHPHTGLGYIEMGDRIYDEEIKVHRVQSFREKPDLETAERFMMSGKFLWNSGMFIAKCSVMIEEIKTHMPKHYESLMKIRDSDFDKKVLEEEFDKLESISIDYGVMEKSSNTYVLKAEMHWDDIGDLAAYDRFNQKDENGNVVRGEMVEVDSENNIVLGKDKLIALVGAKDLIVCETDDVILVADKKKAQDVKTIVKKLTIDKEKRKYVE